MTPKPKTATTKDGKLAFALLGMNVDTPAKGSTIQLAVQGVSDQPPVQMEKPQLLVIEASVKPFMSLIWTGAFLMMFGLAVSVSTKLKRSNQMNA